MKKLIICLALAAMGCTMFTACKNCKKCHTEVFGVKGPEQEICGDQLEKAKQTPGMVCEDK